MLGNVALINGRRGEQAGNVCMDQTMWKLDSVPEAKVGVKLCLLDLREKNGLPLKK
jgi:alanine racemase